MSYLSDMDSFSINFHSNLAGSLSTSCTPQPIQKLDVPGFDWPKAPFPQLKYPLEDYKRENEAEEERCLAQVCEAKFKF